MHHTKTFLVISVFLIVLVACNPNPRESERMAAAMEQAESVYGDGNILMETDTVLFIPGLAEASAYFARKKQFDKAALAALYNGYAEKDYDKEMAMNSFKDAERYGEMIHDSLTVARAEYEMGKMCYYDSFARESLVFYKKANSFFGDRFTDRAFVLNGMAASHILLSEFDSAAMCLDQSLEYASLGHSIEAKRKALNNYSVLYRLTRDYVKAIDCLRQVYPEDKKGQLLNYLNLGEVFAASGEMDSARYYYQLVENHLDESQVRPETKVAAYGSLSKLAEQNSDWKLALIYRKNYDRAFSEIVDKRRQNRVFYIQKKYDNEIIQRQLDGMIIQRKQMFLIACLVFVIITVFAFVMYYRYVQKCIREVELNNVLIQFMEQNEELLKQSAEQEKEHHEIVNQLLDMQKEKIKTMQKLDVFLKDRKDTIALTDLEKQLFLGKDHLEVMLEVIDEAYPGLLAKIKEEYPLMDELEQKVCLLSRFKLSRYDEARVLGVSISVLDKARGRVRKLMEMTKND
jgi:tetratricopeptide (TPR) repeat protein